MIWQIKEAIHGAGLRYHKEKRAVDRPAEITGVIVRDGELVVPNRQRLKLRSLEQAKNKRPDAAELKVLTGKMSGMSGHIAQIAAANMMGYAS